MEIKRRSAINDVKYKPNLIAITNRTESSIGRQIPNIIDISYGRGVGYAFDEEVFDDATQSISATKIRKKMRDEGKLK